MYAVDARSSTSDESVQPLDYITHLELNGKMEPVTCLSVSPDINTFVKSRNNGKSVVRVLVLRNRIEYSAFNLLQGTYCIRICPHYMNDIHVHLWCIWRYFLLFFMLVNHNLLHGLGEKEEIVLTGIEASKNGLTSIKEFLGIAMKEGTGIRSVYGKVRLCSM